MRHALLSTSEINFSFSNDNYRDGGTNTDSRHLASGTWGEHKGCIFKVGDEMYFVPTEVVAGADTLYITCDAQKIEAPMDGWRSRLALGDIAESAVEDRILQHLTSTRQSIEGEAFVITRDRKTFRL